MSEGRSSSKRSYSDTRDDGEPQRDSFAEVFCLKPSLNPKRSKVEEFDDHENASSLVGSLVDPSNSSSAAPNESQNTSATSLQHAPETTGTITTPEELMVHFVRCIEDESDDAVKNILTSALVVLKTRRTVGNAPVQHMFQGVVELFRDVLPPQFISDLQKRMAQPFDYLRQFRSIKSTDITQIVAEADFIAELNLIDMPEAAACFQMWDEFVVGKEVVPTVLNALNKITLEANATEAHSRKLISSVLHAIVELDAESFKSRILDSAPSNSPGEESRDYVFLAQIRKGSDILEYKSTAPSTLGEIPDEVKVCGAGEAQRLLSETLANESLARVALSKKIKEETGAEFNQFTGASNGNSTSGDLACALAQGASYFLGLPENRRPSEYTFFVSNGLLWRFIVVRWDKMLVSKFFLLPHKDLPRDCVDCESSQTVIQYLCFMLFWVSMNAKAEAQFELVRKLPDVSPVCGDARRFIAMNEKNDCVQYTLEYFLGGGSQRLAFAARQFRLGQSNCIPWRLVKVDISAHDGRAAWQSQTEIAVLRKLQGAPGIPTLLECGEFRAGHKYIITDVVGMKLTDFIRTYPSRASAVYWKGRAILEALWASGYILSDINSSSMVVDHNEAVWFADLGGCYRACDPPIRQHRVITAAHATWKAFIGETPTPDDELLSYNALFSAHVLSADQCPCQSSSSEP